MDVNTCGIDEFDGSELDTARWNTVIRPNVAGYGVGDGTLKLRALTGDMYGDRATAQNLILQDAPAGAWTATTRLDSKAFDREGQQAGFIVRKDDATFSKLVVINKGSQGRWFEHVFTANQQPRLEIGTDTTAPLDDTFPRLVYIRAISDGETLRGEYSGDGKTWSPIGRPAKIGGDVQVGVYAADNDQDGPEVPFDFVSLNAQSDEFDGTALERCRWSTIVNEDPDAYRVADGALQIDAGAGEIEDPAPNLFGQPVPAGSWEAETRLDVATTGDGQQGGLLLYKEPRNWIKVALVDKGATSQVELVRVKDGGYQLDEPFKVDVPKSLTSVRLRLRSNGTSATAQYSVNGTDWTEVGQARDIADLAGGTLGPMALRGGSADPLTAKFDYVRVRPGPAPPAAATNLFTTIGITTSATRGNGEIYPPDNPYSLPAEQMPPSGTVGVAPSDSADDVPLRMPETSGTKPNFAALRGQTLTLRDADQAAYAKLHFFGTTTDGGPAGGDFTLGYSDGSTATVTVQFPDWCGSATSSAHFAIGPLSGRNRASSTGDGARCGVYHFPADNPQPGKTLASVTLPPATAGGGANTQTYLMALTLEDANGLFKAPDLSGTVSFPDDATAPVTTHALEPGEPNGDDGWYRGAVHATLTATDEDGGSGVEQIMYRVDGGAPQSYGGPFDYAIEGEHTLEYRSIDGAGNAETYKPVTLKVDAKAPVTTAALTPREPAGGDGWHDGAVTVRLSASDGAGSGSGVKATEYRLDGGDWTAYGDPVVVADAGVHTLEYRSGDVAGHTEAAQALTLKVDGTAPVTSVLINGAAPAAEYGGPVRVAFTRTDGDGSGAVASEYSLDGGPWTAYTGAFDVAGNAGHRVDYRSIDVAGNVENYRSVIFVIRPVVLAPAVPEPIVIPQAVPAPKPRPAAAIERVRGTVAALRAGKVAVRVSCQAVDRGTYSLTVSKATAKRLKLKRRTLARGTVRCGDEGRGSVKLKPSAAAKRALARSKRVTATLALRFGGAARDSQTVTFGGKQ
ncbi:MAG TPA: DUF1349 domain-containing protein [Solirubrobacter sp.]|nr:DUF1349 domain-containing protein [Solirubrobacter sp.]